MAGKTVELETLYPIAMSAARSTARPGMNRLETSGFQVAALSADPTLPAGTGTSYPRPADWLVGLPWTVWVFQSDSTPPMFEYWFCAIRRIDKVSRLLPFFDGTVSGGPAQTLPVEESVGPVNVEFAVLAQSTWNAQTRTRSVYPHTEVK